MKTFIEVKLKPFGVPNFVVRDSDPVAGREQQSFPLSELSAETLEAMCEEFTREVFKKANKQRPPREQMA